MVDSGAVAGCCSSSDGAPHQPWRSSHVPAQGSSALQPSVPARPEHGTPKQCTSASSNDGEGSTEAT